MSPLLEVLGPAGGCGDCAVGIQSLFPWSAGACPPPPWLRDGCALRGGFASGAGQDTLSEELMLQLFLPFSVPKSQIWVKEKYIWFLNGGSSSVRVLKHLRVKHGFV